VDFIDGQLVSPPGHVDVCDEDEERGHQQRPGEDDFQSVFHDHFSFSIIAVVGWGATGSKFDWRFDCLSKRRCVLCCASQSGQSDRFNRCR
jgi:hypothetical protein